MPVEDRASNKSDLELLLLVTRGLSGLWYRQPLIRRASKCAGKTRLSLTSVMVMNLAEKQKRDFWNVNVLPDG